MKKLLLALITLFVMSASSFALDARDAPDVSKKIETFYKSGTYVKIIETKYSVLEYYLKEHIVCIQFYDGDIKLDLDNGQSETKYASRIEKIYLQDGNLIIEWRYDE